jgi:3-deoxy-D-manno-octulosonate cytidylyltransferase
MSDACICVIPARFGSRRLKAKALRKIGGKPMVRHVWERACEAGVFSRIIVATDDGRIRETVRSFGGSVAMTSRRLKSGTERVAAVARRFPAPLIMNLQGDEPFVSSRALASLVSLMRRHRGCSFATLARKAPWKEIAKNPNTVKVAVDGAGRAVYFSRSPVPFDWRKGGEATLLQHVGVYIFRRRFLSAYSRMAPSGLESRERLEQLRVLEHGIRPMVQVVDTPSLSVDTAKDLKLAREWLRRTGVSRGSARRPC